MIYVDNTYAPLSFEKLLIIIIIIDYWWACATAYN